MSLGYSTNKKNENLNRDFGTGKYIGLSVTTPTEGSNTNFTEPSDSKYARTLLQIGTNPIMSASGGEIKNTAIIYIAPMKVDVTVTHYGVFDTQSGGTPFYAAPLTDAEGNPVSVTIPADAIFMLDVGSLSIRML